jgi:hypothetical protein
MGDVAERVNCSIFSLSNILSQNETMAAIAEEHLVYFLASDQ